MKREGVVAFADTDASGWIHFTAPLRWAEETEHALCRSVGVDPSRFPRRAVESRYDRPLRAGERFVVDLRAANVGRTSVTYAWTVHLDGEVAVAGSHTCSHLGDDGRPTPVPDALREVLAQPDNSAEPPAS